MKIFIVIMLLAHGHAIAAATELNQHHTHSAQHETADDSVTYICPMHSNVLSEQPSSCPICGMALVPIQVPALPQQVTSSEQGAVTYVCPMHSEIVSDHPDTCPICGMDLVKVEDTKDSASVAISSQVQLTMGVTTALAETSDLARIISTYGAIAYDENGLLHVHPRAAGWVENLKVKTLGEQVTKGQLLYEIYAPELIVAQDDYLSLLQTNPDNQSLKRRGRTRLNLLGMTDTLINQLEKSRQSMFQVPYFAPNDAIVSDLNIREGMYVAPGIAIMTLADISRVWLIVDVFEDQMQWVTIGSQVHYDIPALDILNAPGVVDYIYPELDHASRTLKVRLALANPSASLKPGMLANVQIHATAAKNALHIPVQALIMTGQQNRVVVRSDDHRFESREVTVGAISQGRAEIMTGLSEGEEVVTSGQFLIDSEANLRAALTNLSSKVSSGTGPVKASEHAH